MLKQLRTVYALVLLVSMNLLPMEKEATDVDEFAQAKEFHERLQRAYHGVLQNGTEAYYKKIDPITANLNKGIDRWIVNSVSIVDEKMYANKDGVYTYRDISFTIKPKADFDPTQSLDILITHGEEYKDIQFAKLFEKKSLISANIDCYDDISKAMHNNSDFGHKLYLIRYLTLKGVLPGENPCTILIECKNWRAQPITFKGMEIVYRKDAKVTNIFFDFADQEDKSVDCFNVIECEHSIIADKNGKKSSTFSDSLKTRKKWIPDESNFYNLDNQVLTSLPKFYSNFDNHQKTFKEPLTWMLDDIDINNLLYQVPDEIWELIFLAQNKHATIKTDMLTKKKAAIQWCAMKNIVNVSLVCKRFNAVAQKLLPSYTKEIKGYIDYIDELKRKKKAANTEFCMTFKLFKNDAIWSFKVKEIRKAMQANLSTTKYTREGETWLTQAIKNRDEDQIRQLLNGGADPKRRNQKDDMPIDLAHAHGLFREAATIKYYGGDPNNKYEYIYDWNQDKYVCKRGQGGQAYTPQQANGLNAADSNPPPIPPQTFSIAAWITRSPSYLFLAGISAGAVAYWVYTKYRAVDEDNKEEDDCLDANAESENSLKEASA